MPKILVIYDNKDYLYILKDVLSTYKPDHEVLTAQSGKEGIKLADHDNVFKAGCNAYMSKPINIKKLLGMISEYC